MKSSVLILGLLFIFFVGVFQISTACAAEVKNSEDYNEELIEAVDEYLKTASDKEYDEFMKLTINYSWKLLPYNNKD